MKLIALLTLAACLALVGVGCKPADTTTTPPAGTNAPAP